MILNHSVVTVFIYMYDDIITKAFLPKKVVNFKATTQANKKVIALVSGDTEENTHFCVLDNLIFSDALHFTGTSRFSKVT